MSKAADFRLYQTSGEPRTIRQTGYALVDTSWTLIVDDTGKPSVSHTLKGATQRKQRGQKIVKVDVDIRIHEKS